MKAKLTFIAALALLVAAGSAQAIEIRAGDLIVNGDGGFTPTTLPKFRDAPITIHGGGSDLHRLRRLPAGHPGRSPSNTTATARCRPSACRSAGRASSRRPRSRRPASAAPARSSARATAAAIVVFPEQTPITVSSPITIFNGPRKNGNATVLAHAYTTVPVPTTFIVPIEIEKINKGVYGYRTEAQIPKIAGGDGIPISGWLKIGRKWTYKGKRHSYINARCETGHLQARGLFNFKDGLDPDGHLLPALQGSPTSRRWLRRRRRGAAGSRCRRAAARSG